MAGVSEQEILDALAKVTEPETGKDIVSAGMIQGLQTKDGHVAFAIEVDPTRGAELEPMRKLAEKVVYDLKGVISATVVLTAERAAEAPPPPGPGVGEPGGPVPKMGTPELLPGVTSIVAVASGKGGVGKTTTTVNLGVALARQGASVGILDADVYGPNIPIMLGADGAPMTMAGKIAPIEAHGIKLMSLGFMLEEGAPVIWRGPMIGGAIGQLLNDVDWGELDYLLIDMPPGTGDASLSLAQLVPVAGALIVSTPQAVALQDVLRSISMWEKLGVPVLGLVENMSYFVNPADGSRLEIFGHGGAREAAEKVGIEFLGEISLDQAIRIGGDSGTPVATDESNPQAAAYAEIAGRMAAAISIKNEERAEPLPML